MADLRSSLALFNLKRWAVAIEVHQHWCNISLWAQ